MPRSKNTPLSKVWLRTLLGSFGVLIALTATVPTAGAVTDEPGAFGGAAVPSGEASSRATERPDELPQRSPSPASVLEPQQQAPVTETADPDWSVFDGWLPATGAMIVGVLALVGVLITSRRTAQAVIDAEGVRHEHDLKADRARRRAAAQYDVYVRMAGLMDQLLRACRRIEAIVEMPAPVPGVFAESTATLSELVTEIEQSRQDTYFLGSDPVFEEVTSASRYCLALWLDTQELPAARDPSERATLVERTGKHVKACLEAADAARRLMREEVRHGELTIDLMP